MTLARASIAVLSLLLAVSAQTATQSVVIPTTLSSTCQDFLTKLNSDTSLASCLTSINNAIAAVNPSSSTQADVQTALGQLCSSSVTCDESAIRSSLTDFSVACNDDFNADDNTFVLSQYDMLYTLLPYQSTLCAKDAVTSQFCVLESSGVGNSTLDVSTDGTQTVLADLDALGAASAPFLFFNADSSPNVLCTSCVQSVLQVYVTYEDKIPYALGVNQSPLLQNQAKLWNAFKTSCGGLAGTVAVNAGAAPTATSGASARMGVSAGAMLAAAAFVCMASAM